ncbi:MAG: hypothetical protein AAF611_07740 [Bacteroidota bacterium]
MKFNLRHISEKLLDVIPNIIEIGITSIHTKPKELSQMIDSKIKKLLEKPKGKQTSKLLTKKQQKRFQERAKEDDAKILLVDYYEQRFPDKEEEKTKRRLIGRLNDLKKIKDIHREFDLEK